MGWKEGDRVKIREDLENPRWGWGIGEPGDTGTVNIIRQMPRSDEIKVYIKLDKRRTKRHLNGGKGWMGLPDHFTPLNTYQKSKSDLQI